MFDSHALEDGRGQFPVVIKARTSVALREAIKQAAALEHLTIGEFIRRVLSERATMAIYANAHAKSDVGG